MRMLIFLLLIIVSLQLCSFSPYKALVIVPVADLLGDTMQTIYPESSVEMAYNTIPLCGGNHNRWNACLRTEQLLFNEIVDVVEKKGKEVKVKISRTYYLTEKNSSKQTEYWMLAHNLIPLDALRTSGIDLRTLPAPITFENPQHNNQATVALLHPFQDSQAGLFFSVGTRFICAKTPKKSSYVNVFAYNPCKKVMQKIKIPKNICVFYDKTYSPQEQRALFVSYIQQWAHLPTGFIPYVWGGSSFVYPYSGPFIESMTTVNGKKTSFFDYTDIKHTPHTGFDCSGLVARAAQLAGMPYFYKNTYTISERMTPIKTGEHLQMGDLIWTPGHVMIASDIDNNLVAEARGYFQGHGKVHEIPLNKVLKNINTYQDLEQAFFNKKAIKRIDKEGYIRDIIPVFLLLDLESAWKDS